MRIIVIGADGVIGQALCASLKARGHVVAGTTRRTAGDSAKDRIFLDLAAASLPVLPEADVAIICAAMSKFADCRKTPDLARRVDVTAPLKLADDFTRLGGRVLMLSSSVVFDCLRPHMKADAPASPRSDYGKFKAEAESGILTLGGCVLRLTKVITAESGTLADWIVNLRQGKTIRAFKDHRFCPLPLPSVLDAIAAIIEQQQNGVFQLSGAEDISYADAARHLASRLDVPSSRIEDVLAVESGIPESEVTPYTSLDTSRLSALMGFVPPMPRAVIDRVHAAAFPHMSVASS